MRFVVLMGVILLLSWSVAVGKIYKWVDRQGAVHFTDNPAAVPEPYRDQVDAPASAPSANSHQTPLAPPVSPAIKGVVVPLERVGSSMVVQAKLNGLVRSSFVVDTGASLTVISTQAARRLGLNLQRAAVIQMQSVSGSFLARFTKVKSFAVGDVTVKDVDVIVHDTSPGESVGLLGMSFLDSFQVTINSASNSMRLTPLDQDANTVLVGGKSEDWWKRKFRFYRQQLSLSKSHLALRTSPEFENTRRYFQSELASLERQASRAAVPRQWRY